MTGRPAPTGAGVTARTIRLDSPATRGPGWSVVVGAVCGVAWSASLRGWMIQVAGAESAFTWLGTFGLLLAPGTALGGLLGWAVHLQRGEGLAGARRRWLLASPVLLAAPLLDPNLFRAFVTSGLGGGALGVLLTGLTGGYAIAGSGSRLRRTVAGVAATVLILACGSIVAADAPLTTPHGAWVALQAVSLLAVLCAACSLPYPARR